MGSIGKSWPAPRIASVTLGLIVGLFGAALALGGGYLLTLGGSAYFLLMGLALLASSLLLIRRRRAGAWVYGAAFLATIVWSIFEAGFAFWPLVSRLFAFAVLGILIGLLYPWLGETVAGRRKKRSAWAVAGMLALCVTAAAAYSFVPVSIVEATDNPPIIPAANSMQKDWRFWGNDAAGTRFAALDQIDRTNVGQLDVAWTFHTGDIAKSDGFGAEDQNTPLQIGDTLYVCTPYNKVIAVDGDSGRELWRYDSQTAVHEWQRCRGLGYFDATADGLTNQADPARQMSSPGDCSRRLFMTTMDGRLIALDKDSGKLCAGFGKNGIVDLRVDMGQPKIGFYTPTSAPLVAGNKVIVAGRITDNHSTGEPGGVIRAFDVRTGTLVWAMDPDNAKTTKRPEPGAVYTRGTPNVWSTMAYDPQLDMIYMPTGNATPDFFGGHRTAQDEAYASSIVALSGATGRVQWTFQTVHHDVWDYDVPAQPTLTDVPDGKGRKVPALVQVTKTGQIFLLNRVTGKPIADVVEKAVPRGDVPGERYAPTQPFSVGMPSIGTADLRESDMWGATPVDQMLCRIMFKKMIYHGKFTAPSLKGPALQWPGALGGMNWGSASVDPTSGYLFVNDMRLGYWTQLIPRNKVPADAGGVETGVMSQFGTPYGASHGMLMTALGVPCQKPPYGTMTAINLATRKIAWQVPMGTLKDTGPMGVAMHLPIPVGMPTLGGSIATQSGLLFFAGTQDNYLRAMDSRTGKTIWKGRLPIGSQATPMTYISPKTGRQYVVIVAGGARQSPKRGDQVIAYALPKAAAEPAK
ncbi:membrane-bound PQQ-dependent dehydrogenase, glucose/quinate/shikimate family [Sphingobium xenophagum]|uniref:membrane-bound PQQ-dependent dehydrogenase, glucose/quinate/shikimate family n=1 Tax=Sphingobium xenophagum TaxID=121428 RepID=UPI001FD549A3|nr:membrane-bound PQQ-dependent dehydrogenase, glucose/quinate/shikimate family [Sphingobium xenophagum]